MFISFLFLIISPSIVNAQLNCNEAPTEALEIVCNQLHQWDEGARNVNTTAKPTSSSPKLVPLKAMILPSTEKEIHECFDHNCICRFLRGNVQNGECVLQNGQIYRKIVRKEYRMLTDDERRRFHTAMWTIRNNGEFGRLSEIHANISLSPAAHSGPAFLPWHREYIKRLESALRQIDPSVGLPYWDSTLDSAIPNSVDSMMFSDELFGTTQGFVTTGVFANWRLVNNQITRRAVGAQGRVFSEVDVRTILDERDVNQVLAFTAPRQGCPYPARFTSFEYSHGNPHIFIGGDMIVQTTSTNDPLFFLHHSFVDLIWELWRQSVQSRSSRETEYPPDRSECAAAAHFANTVMTPFAPMANIDGLTNIYTDVLYEYAPRPTCSPTSDCGSKYLFCDLSHGRPRCASKIKNGGNCGGFLMGEPPCYEGSCNEGICQNVPRPPTPQTSRRPPTSPPLPPITRTSRGPTYGTKRPTYPIDPNDNQGPIYIEPGYVEKYPNANDPNAPHNGIQTEPGFTDGQVHYEPGYGSVHTESGYRGYSMK